MFGTWKVNYEQLKEHLEAEIPSTQREISPFKLHRDLWDYTQKLFKTIWQKTTKATNSLTSADN